MSDESTHWGGDLDEVLIETDEQGWELVIETNSGTYRFSAQGVAHFGVLADQLRKVTRELDDWWGEGQQAAREHAATLVDEGGYDPSDPKSPGYHDRMVGDA